jgi:diguanylate cyclase (GGDEF)-like protein
MEIVNDLLTARPNDLDGSIDAALDKLGRFTASDRTYVFRIRDGVALDNTHEWCEQGTEPVIDQLQDLPVDIAADWWALFDNDGVVEIPDVDALPESRAEKPILKAQGIKSLLAVPMVMHGEVAGFMGYDSVHAHRHFLTGELDLIRTVANVVAFTLDKRDLERQARRALYDSVTQMPNRHSLHMAMARNAGAGHGDRGQRDSHAAIIFIDLNHFKEINDNYGHAVGDRVLARIGERINTLQRPDDAGYRYGGDEFVVIARDLSARMDKARDEAGIVASRLVNGISQPMTITGDQRELTFHVSASAGVVITHSENEGWDALVRRADHAMYEAKESGEAYSFG